MNRKPSIALNEVEVYFRQRLATTAPPGTPLTIGLVLDVMSQFYLDTSIASIDTSAYDNDMLLFQWGTYYYEGEMGRQFCLDVTRQFQLEGEEEFWQLSCSLYYPPEYDALGAGSCWSVECETLQDWRRGLNRLELATLANLLPSQVKIILSAT
ncbi:hypothetical protein [Hymenobacter sp. UYP22]|uniref:hypothetical protein n=1 Tax=Hymenobacter sp. UYP22 TaxID=3156348 RepID=UPI0033979852